jgi:hypothetical protein
MLARSERPTPQASHERPRRPIARAIGLLLLGLGACEGRELSLGDGRGGAAQSRDGSAPAASASAAVGGDGLGGVAGDAGSIDRRPFSEPQLIAAISGADKTTDDDPALTRDRAELFFNSKREGGAGKEDVWFARAQGDDWSAPEVVAELNTEERETGIALSASGLRIWFSSDRDGGDGGLDVYTATRPDRSAGWSTPERVAELSSPDDDLVSAVNDVELSILMARRPDEGDYHVWSAQRARSDAPWSAPQPLASITSDADESDACFSAGGLRLVFTRDGDLYWAERSSLDGEFLVLGPLSELNSEDDDRDAWVADDLSLIVFSSDRAGSYKLYSAQR